MAGTDSAVQGHYTRDDIARRVLAAARRAAGAGVALTPDVLAPIDHFHGGGLASTRELVAMLEPQAGDAVLDIGCGIGGPARWIAAAFGCHVTGIDLTAAFCRAAGILNAETGMADKVKIFEASALALPFEAESFDRAYSQNVVMNIADKRGFYREAFRVLRPGGVLALSNLCAGSGGTPYYPAPWASTAATSFLSTQEETLDDLKQTGFEIARFEDTSAKTMAGRKAQRQRLESEGLPPLGPHVFMGEHMSAAWINSARSAEEGRVTTVEILARKPG